MPWTSCRPAPYWDQTDKRFAFGTFHWGFWRGGGLPEKLIGADPISGWVGSSAAGRATPMKIPDEVMTEYRRCFRRRGHRRHLHRLPRRRHLDYEHDKADLRAGKKIECPVYAFWSGTFVDDRSDALASGGNGRMICAANACSQTISFRRRYRRISWGQLGFLRE